MAAKGDRRLSFYFPTAADKERWRKLAEPLPLTQWIWLKVEASLEKETAEQASAKSSDSETVNRLIRENDNLKKENESLWESLNHFKTELEQIRGSPLPLDKDVVDLLKSGGTWTSIQLTKKLGKGALRSEIKDNLRLDIKAIDLTLETLVNMELAEKTWVGWRWKN